MNVPFYPTTAHRLILEEPARERGRAPFLTDVNRARKVGGVKPDLTW